METRPPENYTIETSKEREPERTHLLFLVSDIHMLAQDKVDDLWQRLNMVSTEQHAGILKSEQHTIIMGDLPLSEFETNIVAEFKSAKGDKSKLTFEDKAEEDVFDRSVAKRGWRAGVYREAKMNSPEKLERARQSNTEMIKGLAEKLKNMPNPIVYPGNAETNSPYGGFPEAFQDKEVPYYQEPACINLDEDSAVIVWPSTKDPKSMEPDELISFEENMEKKVSELLIQVKAKKNIIITAHEHPFHGSRQFESRTKGTTTYGTPFHGVNPTREHLFRFIASLSPEQKVGMAYGHLHDPDHIIRQGTGLDFAASESGGAKWGVRTKNVDGEVIHKELDLFYVPHGGIGVLKIDKSGLHFECKEP